MHLKIKKSEAAEFLFDSNAETYDTQLQDNLGSYGKDLSYYSEYKVILVKKYTHITAQNILDFGCGIGRNIPFFQKYFPDSNISGCDISEKSLIAARENNPSAEFFNIKGISTQQIEYDIILTANVFHHIEPENRDEVFKHIFSMLRPGGEVFIFEHNPLNPLTVRAVNTCPFDEGVILLKPDEVLYRAAASGFKLLQKKYCLFFPSALRFLSPVEKLLYFIPLGGQYFVQLIKD